MDLLAATLNDTSSERAQQQLDALRTVVETRLSALEAVLADPSRGESLEGLILDLARVATEEARAVALKASLDARLEADARVADARTVAQEAIDQERVGAGELRRSIEQARRRIASLEQGQLTDLRGLREELESEISRERATAANFERAASETRRQLEAERGAGADLRLALENERQASVELRAAAEAEQNISADLRLSLDAERTSGAELRLAAEQTRTLSTTLAREKSEAWAAQDALTVALARDRGGAAKLQRLNEELQEELAAVRTDADTIRVDLEAAGARLEMLDSERLRADRARKELEARLDALVHERDALMADLRPSHEPQRDGETASPAASVAAPARHEAASAARAQPDVLPDPPPARCPPEGEWGPVRLAVRYAFRQPIPIQINGDAGLLVDLSVAGCQLVSSSSVKPNQIVKVLLASEETTIPCTGKVMWARFEPRSAGAIGYRAGVHFTKPDQAALEAFIASSRLLPPH